MKLVDIGANLTHKSFEQDFDKVIGEATEAGLVHIIITGTDLETSNASHIISVRQPTLFSSTVGFHPHISKNVTDADISAAAELALKPHVVAIGEIGLDFNRNYSPPKHQLRVFELLLELAVELQKPVFLHQRDAHKEFHNLLTVPVRLGRWGRTLFYRYGGGVNGLSGFRYAHWGDRMDM